MEITQEWIDQYNKKCAEFIGWKSSIASEYYTTTMWGGCGFTPFHMKFHSDWNWIMEVVEKIVEIPDGVGYQFKRSIEGCFDSKQEVIQAIDQFIDWYNKQKES